MGIYVWRKVRCVACINGGMGGNIFIVGHRKRSLKEGDGRNGAERREGEEGSKEW